MNTIKRNGNVIKTIINSSEAIKYFDALKRKSFIKGVVYHINSKSFKTYINNNEFVFTLKTCSASMNKVK